MTPLPTLAWFPKPFGAGDTDGTGAQRLLGQPDLTTAQLLVRETAQNSWDAAIAGRVPEFQMRYRVLDAGVMWTLKNSVFKEAAPGSKLLELLAAGNLDAVEVLDRGTKGLGGPTRNDIETAPGEITDYADFVLTVGAPPENAHGGGTFGYGKTASYIASRCSTIIIWSRARQPTGEIAERFIASAMDASFSDAEGKKFTGRQWWGLRPSNPEGSDEFVVEPVEGDDAAALGQAIFERPFEKDETGTSLLILAPRRPEDSSTPGTLVSQWAAAIDENLWPKLIAGQDSRWTMRISLMDRGSEVPIGDQGNAAERKAREDCLNAIRAKQDGHPLGNSPVFVETIRHGSRRAEVSTLGHLALTRVFGSTTESSSVAWMNAVTYMRHSAELVVKSDPLRTPSGDGGWLGVFKPVANVDPDFAKSEPPAHESWNVASLNDSWAKSTVTVALNKIARAVKDYLTPTAEASIGDSLLGTGGIAGALGGLIAGTPGSKPLPQASKAPKRRGSELSPRRERPKVDVVWARPVVQMDFEKDAGRQRTRVRLSNPKLDPIVVGPRDLAIAIDGSKGVDADEVRIEEWVLGDRVETGQEFELGGRCEVEVDISYPQGVAIQFSFAARSAK